MMVVSSVRSPKDDEPPYDPTCWDKDCFFLSAIERNPALFRGIDPDDTQLARTAWVIAKQVVSILLKAAAAAAVLGWKKLRRKLTRDLQLEGRSVSELQELADKLCVQGDQEGAALVAKELAKRNAALGLRSQEKASNGHQPRSYEWRERRPAPWK